MGKRTAWLFRLQPLFSFLVCGVVGLECGIVRESNVFFLFWFSNFLVKSFSIWLKTKKNFLASIFPGSFRSPFPLSILLSSLPLTHDVLPLFYCSMLICARSWSDPSLVKTCNFLHGFSILELMMISVTSTSIEALLIVSHVFFFEIYQSPVWICIWMSIVFDDLCLTILRRVSDLYSKVGWVCW